MNRDAGAPARGWPSGAQCDSEREEGSGHYVIGALGQWDRIQGRHACRERQVAPGEVEDAIELSARRGCSMGEEHWQNAPRVQTSFISIPSSPSAPLLLSSSHLVPHSHCCFPLTKLHVFLRIFLRRPRPLERSIEPIDFALDMSS